MPFRAPIGYSDFRELRRAGATYVDKSRLIGQLLSTTDKVVLLPRPRRFGKTLNLSLLRYFFEHSDEDRADLFADLQVWSDAQARAHYQRHPVLLLSFKDVKQASWEDCLVGLRNEIAKAVNAQRSMLEEAKLSDDERQALASYTSRTASAAELATALYDLSAWLKRATGETVVILVDEYDTPIHAGYVHGYHDEVVGFFRNLLSGGFKDNTNLFRGVITGILRVAKESIFSGLNNLAVYSLLRPEYATRFGFTESEVVALAEMAGASDQLDVLRSWYNGYLFGGEVIYNPWSVLNFLASTDRLPRPYWVSTSSNDLIEQLLTRQTATGLRDLERVLAGEGVEQEIQEDISLRDLERRTDAIWSLLLFSGYLKADNLDYDLTLQATLSLPNREVRSVYHKVFRDWMRAQGGGASRVRDLLRAMLAGDTEPFGDLLGELLASAMSYHDTSVRAAEHIYHAFVLGLLVNLEGDYEVRSNRESGYGRADVLVRPRQPGKPGVVLELKSLREGETPEHALDSAEAQIRERDYAAELRAAGAQPIHALAIAFDGKRVWVRGSRL